MMANLPIDPNVCHLKEAEKRKFVTCENRLAVRTKVCQEEGEAIDVNIVDGHDDGASFYIDAEGTAVADTEVTLITYLVPAGKTLKLKNINATGTFESEVKIKVDGALIGSGRTGPANHNFNYNFDPRREVAEGKTLTVTIKQRANTPDCATEAYLQARLV